MMKSAPSISATAVSAAPTATCSTCSGAPDSRRPSASSSEVSGVTSEGLMITAFPAARAGIASPNEFVSG
jgi:hypothetical protein